MGSTAIVAMLVSWLDYERSFFAMFNQVLVSYLEKKRNWEQKQGWKWKEKELFQYWATEEY
jgi:hypothetical protein